MIILDLPKVQFILNFFLIINSDDPRDATIKMLVRALVKRNVFLLSFTLLSFLPNNVIFFFKLIIGFSFMDSIDWFNYLILAIMSFNGCYSFLIIISDPYMKKFFKSYFNFFEFLRAHKKHNEINKLSDLVELINNNHENNECDLNKNFLLSKISDYNYANIYLKSDNQEMKYLNKKDFETTTNPFNGNLSQSDNNFHIGKNANQNLNFHHNVGNEKNEIVHEDNKIPEKDNQNFRLNTKIGLNSDNPNDVIQKYSSPSMSSLKNKNINFINIKLINRENNNNSEHNFLTGSNDIFYKKDSDGNLSFNNKKNDNNSVEGLSSCSYESANFTSNKRLNRSQIRGNRGKDIKN